MSAVSMHVDSDTGWVALPCVCANVRRLARLATRFYDDALRPTGLEIGQFALLATIRSAPGITQSRLSQGLGMDTTSLTRTLALMLRRGWIHKRRASDRRSHEFAVTADGDGLFLGALPHWRQAQQRFAAMLGAEQAQQLSAQVEAASLVLKDHAPRGAAPPGVRRASRTARAGAAPGRARARTPRPR